MKEKDSVLVIAAFLISRLLFFTWLSTYSSIYQAPDYNGREPARLQEGLWVEDVQKIVKGEAPTAWEDAGMPYLMVTLHKTGIPIKQTFFWACLLMTLCAVGPLFFFYRYLKGKMGLPGALTITLLLALYPPGVYYSFFNVMRIFPVYLFLMFIVLLLWSEKFFDRLNWQRVLLYLAIGAYSSFMVMSRKSNNVVLAAGLLALGIKLYPDKEKLKRFALFAAIIIGVFFAGWYPTRNNQHLVWHSLYHGLADFDNKHGFRNTDDYSQQAAIKENPAVATGHVLPYGHPEYDLTLRKLYFRAVQDDPIWYARILALRAAKLIFMPFHGSWVMPLARDLEPSGLYRAARMLTAGLDLGLVLLGTFAIFLTIKREPLKEILPFAVLLSSVLYIYVLIVSSNRTLYVAGAYFHIFFALQFLWMKTQKN